MSENRISHGEMLSLGTGQTKALEDPSSAATVSEPAVFPFGYMFPELQAESQYLLPESLETVDSLKALGAAMIDPGPPDPNEDPGLASDKIPGVPIPTAYTFFGQFVDHDITFERASESIRDISGPNLVPISPEEIRQKLVNSRSPNLELDSMYSHLAPKDLNSPNKLRLDYVSYPELLPKGKGVLNDLPRHAPTAGASAKTAMIGDPRNDENVIVSQLHVAFIHAHNALVDRGWDFEQAREQLIQHYQWIVLDDFLDRVADPEIVKRVLHDGPRFFPRPSEGFFMPLEFSVAAYRFGHSKVREFYRLNDRQDQVSLGELFAATKSMGGLLGQDHLPGNWVIDWRNFVWSDDPRLFPRPIDTTLSSPLCNLGPISTIAGEGNLAIRNLLRGYILRMPTGQAVARWMQKRYPGIRPLTAKQIESVVSAEQFAALKGPPDLTDKTPLWFYILAEAAYHSRGYHLGPVGSTIVAEVIIGVLRNSDYSILSKPGWKPSLPGKTPGQFNLSDLLRFAGVL